MDNKIFISGATGTIGGNIVCQLQEDTFPFVTGLNKKPEEEPKFPYALIDFGNICSLEKAFSGMHTVFLLLPIVQEIKVFAFNAIEAAKRAGITHIVRSGAQGATSESPYELIRLHGEIDEMLENSGIDYTITQPTGFMQNFINFLGYSIKQGMVYSSSPNGKVSFVDAKDIAAVNVAVLKEPQKYTSQKISVSGGEAFTLPEGLNRLGKVLKRNIEFTAISHEAAVQSLKEYGTPDKVAELIGSVEKAANEGAMSLVSESVQNILGRPPISFEQFIQENLQAWS